MAGLNVALACALFTRVSTQVSLLPLQAPPHPANVLKVEGSPGVLVSVTWVPDAKGALHIEGQLIPAGLLVTLPVSVPGRVTVSVGGPCVKEAETDVLLFKVTTQAPMPLQAPPHPAKFEPPLGVCVNVTCVPVGKFAAQTVPQLIPAGVLVTVPVPVPESDTV